MRSWRTNDGTLLTSNDPSNHTSYLGRDDNGAAALLTYSTDTTQYYTADVPGRGAVAQFDLIYAFRNPDSLYESFAFGGFSASGDLATAAAVVSLIPANTNVESTVQFRHLPFGGGPPVATAPVPSGGVGIGPWWFGRATFDAVNGLYKNRVYDVAGNLVKDADIAVPSGRMLDFGATMTTFWNGAGYSSPASYGRSYRRIGGIFSAAELASAVAAGPAGVGPPAPLDVSPYNFSATIAPGYYTADTTGVAVDMGAATGTIFATLSISSLSTGATAGGWLEESADGAAWTPISGSNFASLTTATASNTVAKMRALRYVRAVMTLAGTSPETYAAVFVGKIDGAGPPAEDVSGLIALTLPAARYTDDATGNTIDMGVGTGTAFLVLATGSVGAGTTYWASVQQSSNGSSWSDIDPSSVAPSTLSDSVRTISFRRQKRYLRVTVELGGSTPDVYASALVGHINQ